ncbi:hypothetical protein O181_102407 [Austropuccinia psidii MF-1]|uniref:Uncharacterized protein n=1 Tax=Austropuccinia psidii MF-1 TaxID=1389203 RepID=A0A9Q3JHT2_9BASI|nr:hypothetical protein [Austropuccinia psidii MF-1]
MSPLGHSNTSYKSFLTISIDKQAIIASWFKLPSVHTLPHPYVIIDKMKKPFLPVVIYAITPFAHSSGHSQILKDLFITLMSLSQTKQEIKTNKHVLGEIMKGIGFCHVSDSENSAGIYSQKHGFTPQVIKADNKQWTKPQQYDELIHSIISYFSKLAANKNQSLIEAAILPHFTQL